MKFPSIFHKKCRLPDGMHMPNAKPPALTRGHGGLEALQGSRSLTLMVFSTLNRNDTGFPHRCFSGNPTMILRSWRVEMAFAHIPSANIDGAECPELCQADRWHRISWDSLRLNRTCSLTHRCLFRLCDHCTMPVPHLQASIIPGESTSFSVILPRRIVCLKFMTGKSPGSYSRISRIAIRAKPTTIIGTCRRNAPWFFCLTSGMRSMMAI